MWSKASLDSSREVAQGCGVSFVNCLYLVPLIIGQNFCATSNQTGPILFLLGTFVCGAIDFSSKHFSNVIDVMTCYLAYRILRRKGAFGNP